MAFNAIDDIQTNSLKVLKNKLSRTALWDGKSVRIGEKDALRGAKTDNKDKKKLSSTILCTNLVYTILILKYLEYS